MCVSPESLTLFDQQSAQAFDFLGSALTHDPRHARALLAAASVLQDHGDYDVALIKYRVAAAHSPNSAQLWNNVGMCFFGKQKFVGAIACLKRALYLDPFEWIISYNLGLVHMHTQQWASAFHHLSCAVALNPQHAPTFAQLAVCLSNLDDYDNARAAYEKSLSIDRSITCLLNSSVTALKFNDTATARQHFIEVSAQLPSAPQEFRDEPLVQKQVQLLQNALP